MVSVSGAGFIESSQDDVDEQAARIRLPPMTASTRYMSFLSPGSVKSYRSRYDNRIAIVTAQPYAAVNLTGLTISKDIASFSWDKLGYRRPKIVKMADDHVRPELGDRLFAVTEVDCDHRNAG